MGSLGLWYPANEKVLSALQIGWKYVTLSVWSPPLLALRLYYMYTEEKRTSHSGVTTRTCTCTIKSLHYTSLTAFATQLYSPFDMSHKLSCGEIGMSNHLFKSYHYQLSDQSFLRACIKDCRNSSTGFTMVSIVERSVDDHCLYCRISNRICIHDILQFNVQCCCSWTLFAFA